MPSELLEFYIYCRTLFTELLEYLYRSLVTTTILSNYHSTLIRAARAIFDTAQHCLPPVLPKRRKLA